MNFVVKYDDHDAFFDSLKAACQSIPLDLRGCDSDVYIQKLNGDKVVGQYTSWGSLDLCSMDLPWDEVINYIEDAPSLDVIDDIIWKSIFDKTGIDAEVYFSDTWRRKHPREVAFDRFVADARAALASGTRREEYIDAEIELDIIVNRKGGYAIDDSYKSVEDIMKEVENGHEMSDAEIANVAACLDLDLGKYGWAYHTCDHFDYELFIADVIRVTDGIDRL